MVCGAAGAAKTPNIDDFRPVQKPCIKNPSVLLYLRHRLAVYVALPHLRCNLVGIVTVTVILVEGRIHC